MKPLVSCAFPPCWYVDVCRFVSKMTKQLLVLKRGKEGRKEQRFSVWVCVLTPPSVLNMDSSKPLGSTTWTDPQLRAKTVVFLQNKSLFLLTILSFSYQNRKESDRFFSSIFCTWSFPFLLRHVGSYFEGFQVVSNCVFHLIVRKTVFEK